MGEIKKINRRTRRRVQRDDSAEQRSNENDVSRHWCGGGVCAERRRGFEFRPHSDSLRIREFEEFGSVDSGGALFLFFDWRRSVDLKMSQPGCRWMTAGCCTRIPD
jgi:hypothetical protein